MANKSKFWLWLAGIGAFIMVLFLGKDWKKSQSQTGELEKKAAWHKDKDKAEQKRLDQINQEKGSREGIHEDNKNNLSKPVSGILIAILFFSAVTIEAKYIKEVDGELRDFGTQENYVQFLEIDRVEYQKDVEIRDREIAALKRNNSTKSNIIAIQDEELRIHRRRDKPLVRFFEKIDFELGLTTGIIGATLLSIMVRNYK